MNREPKLLARTCFVMLLSVCLGCNSETESSNQHDDHGHDHGHEHGHDHGHPERPETLQAAIAELVVIRDSIRTSMENEDPESAHDPLHQVGFLLQGMPDLAADTDLPESEWNSINEQVERLLDAFDELDLAFHDDSDPQAVYESTSSVIDKGVAAMQAKLALLEDETTSSADEQEQHDHEELESHD